MSIRKWMAAFTTTGLIALNGTAAEPAIQLTVPLGVEVGTGPSWGAAH